jgi:hypothetical protein
MTQLHRGLTTVAKTDVHEVHLEERLGRLVVVDEVSGFRAAIYSSRRADEVGDLLRAWGWLRPPLGAAGHQARP